MITDHHRKMGREEDDLEQEIQHIMYVEKRFSIIVGCEGTDRDNTAHRRVAAISKEEHRWLDEQLEQRR